MESKLQPFKAMLPPAAVALMLKHKSEPTCTTAAIHARLTAQLLHQSLGRSRMQPSTCLGTYMFLAWLVANLCCDSDSGSAVVTPSSPPPLPLSPSLSPPPLPPDYSRLCSAATLNKLCMNGNQIVVQEQLESQVQQQASQQQQELQQQSQALHQSLEAAQQQLHSKTEATAEAEANLQEAQQQLQQLQAHVKDLSDSLQAAQAADIASRQELKQKEQARRSLQKENQNSKQELQRLRQQLAQAQPDSAVEPESRQQAPQKVHICSH